ncbi:hypothetical protein C4568_04745 [Candidatus Parcubacteria bacterium]|nr:MAG: hypothetical protein C4568_04745 [Candidatus Parcubacteria bacterium]
MHWLRTHPFALLFAGAGVILLTIIIIINGKTLPTSSFGIPVTTVSTGGSTLQDPGISERYPTTGGTVDTTTEIPPSDNAATSTSTSPTIPLPSGSQAQPSAPTQSTNPDEAPMPDPILTFGGSSGTAASGPNTSLGDSILDQAYALMPTSYTLPTYVPVVRTPEQQALYLYGNMAGLTILTFSNEHADMGDVLTEWVESPSANKAAAQDIAADMIHVGETLLALTGVPATASAANQALGLAYQESGQELQDVISGGGSVNAMKSYNATVEDFTRSYLAVVDLFVASGVTFAPTDTGSAFSPQGASMSSQ